MMRQFAKQTAASSKTTAQLSAVQSIQHAVQTGTTSLYSAQNAKKYYSSINVNTIKDNAPTATLPPFPHFPIPRVNSTSTDAAQELVNWIKTYKGFVNPVLHVGCIQQYTKPGASDDGNWGLVVKEKITKDTILVTVPVPLCLFPADRPVQMENTPTPNDQVDSFYQGVAGISSAVHYNFWQLRLGIRLLAERAADSSFYSPYINALPSSFPSHPLFFSREAVNALQYLPLQKSVGIHSRTIHALAKHLVIPDPSTPYNQIPPMGRLTIGTFNGFQPSAADLAWAATAVGSRAFHSPLTPSTTGTPSEKADAKCLVPLIDMCNHSFKPNCKSSFMAMNDDAIPTQYKSYHVVLRAVRDIEAGEELSLNYFRPSNIVAENDDDLATLVSQMSMNIARGSHNASLAHKSIRKYFVNKLTTAPEFTEEGLESEVSNDDLLLLYGFTPSFNAGDNISLAESIALFATALEMSHDITISPDNEFDDDPMDMATPEVSDNEEEELDENGLPVLKDIFTEADRIVAEAKKNRGKLMKPTINVVLPLVKDQSQLQKDIIEDLPTLGMPLSLTYRGPNEALVSLLRTMVMGARIPGEGTVEEIRDRDLGIAEKRARDKLKTLGDEKAYDRQLHPSEWVYGLGSEEPISDANEKAAMALLYHMLVMASASFPHKLHNDTQLLSNAIRKRQEDEYTAIRFSRSKKQLISHSMKVLAENLNLDDNIHKWHYILD